MKFIIIAGAAATGKTSVMLHTIQHLNKQSLKTAVVKIDCIKSDDEARYRAINAPVVTGLSQDLCPDHFVAINMVDMVKWAEDEAADILLLETAGLCNRCAPYTDQAYSICTVDALSSVRTPDKLGPMLTTADLVIMTRGDMVSQSEREVLQFRLKKLNPRANIVEANGLTGMRTSLIAKYIQESMEMVDIEGQRLRHTMPSATCSYCVGEIRIGDAYQQGIVNKMVFRRCPNV